MISDPIVHHAFNIPIRFGSVQWQGVTGFGIAVFLSFLIAQVVSEHELRRRGFDRDAMAVGDVLLGAIGGTLIGAKLYYVIVLTHDWRDIFTRGGFVFWGGLMGSVVLCFLIIKFKKLSFARFADVGGIAIAAGYAVGRTGCWAVGDDYGKWYTGPLAVAFPDGQPPSTVGVMSEAFGAKFPAEMDPGTVVSVIPTQLIEVALGFVMFLILWKLRTHRHAEGWLLGVYCVLAGIERFAVEFLRAKDDRFFGALSMAQMIAIAITLVGVAVMVERQRAGRSGGGGVGARANTVRPDPVLSSSA